MEKFFEWIRNITYYIIFMTVVVSLLPDKKYEKYIRLFAGMILILLVLKPITGSLRLDDALVRYFEEISLKKEASELRGKFSEADGKRLEAMISGYEEAVETDLRSMADTAGFQCTETAAQIDKDETSSTFGHVVSVYLILKNKEEGSEGNEEKESGMGKTEGGKTEGGEAEPEPIKKVRKIEQVRVGETKADQGENRRQKENSQLSGLRRRIMEYYDLEEQEIEIQMEDGKG